MQRFEAIAELTRLLGKERVLSSRRDRRVYSYDATPESCEPEVVVFPISAAEIAAAIGLARQAGMPIVARGAGTNLSGGTVPSRDSVVVSCTLMNHILEIDVQNQRAVVEAGVVNLDLQHVLSPLGYLYAPDPSSQKVTTLAGNVGENAGGPHCLKHGVTTNHVLGLEVVLSNGDVVHTGGQVEDSPGYDLTGLMVGSEGTLGVVASATLRLMRLPESIKTMLAVFDSLEAAGAAVADVIAAGIIPATLEVMDGATVEAVEAGGVRAGYPRGAGSVLLIELDGLAEGQDRQADRIADLCRARGVLEIRVARDEAERDQLWVGRRGAYSALVGTSTGSAVHDLTVPRSRLAETMRRISQMCDSHGLTIAGAAHAGDGNLHPVVLFDAGDPDQVERAYRANREIIELCLAMGGTITGEHGVGLEKLPYMPMLFGAAELEAMRSVKAALDPDGILNPGKLLPA